MDKPNIKGNLNEVEGEFMEESADLNDNDQFFTEGAEEEPGGRLLKKIGHTMEFLRDFLHKI